MPQYPGIRAVAGFKGYGLIDFVRPNAERYYTAPHDAALDCAAGSWAWGVWIRADGNAGTAYQYLISSGPLGTAGSLNIYLGEDSIGNGIQEGAWSGRLTDDGGTSSVVLNSTNTPGGDGVERLVVVQDDGTDFELYLVPKNGTASLEANAGASYGSVTPPNAWHFGTRQDLDPDRFYEEHAGGLFKANRALTTTEMESIAAGQSPVDVLGADCAEFWPFKGGAVSVETGVVAGIDATRQGTGW